MTNPTARTFRAFAEQTGSDLKALAACIRSARAPITAEDLARLQCPVLVVVGALDVIGGSAQALADLIPGARALEIEDRDHMKAVGDRRFAESARRGAMPRQGCREPRTTQRNPTWQVVVSSVSGMRAAGR